MYRMITRAFCALSLSVAFLGLIQRATGEIPSRFAATYQISNVVESGSSVNLTIKLTLLNPNNSAVSGGIVVLYNSQPGRTLLGSFSTIKSLPAMGQATTSESFTISAAEYARWQKGQAPILDFIVPSSVGARTIGIQAHRVTPGEPTN